MLKDLQSSAILTILAHHMIQAWNKIGRFQAHFTCNMDPYRPIAVFLRDSNQIFFFFFCF